MGIANNYAKALKPRLKKLTEAGISINEIFRRAEIARSNWSRWSSGDTSPTMKTHNRLIAVIEKAEAEIVRKAKNSKRFDPDEI